MTQSRKNPKSSNPNYLQTIKAQNGTGKISKSFKTGIKTI
jgi:hypothetical protein